MEGNLYDDKIIPLHESEQKASPSNLENKSLIQLEATLLNMASTENLCKGVPYIFPVKVMDIYIVR